MIPSNPHPYTGTALNPILGALIILAAIPRDNQ